jgi:hypothetical protein
MCCLFTLRKTNTSRLSHSKNCNKSSMRKCLFTLRKTNTSRFPHSKNCNKFSMRKCVVVFLSVNRHFLILDLLQFLEWDNLEVFVFLSVNRQHIFSCRKTNTSKLSHSKNCNKFSMRKCVVCSHWEKQTLQGYPILKMVINIAKFIIQFLEWGNLKVFVFLTVNRQHIFSC